MFGLIVRQEFQAPGIERAAEIGAQVGADAVTCLSRRAGLTRGEKSSPAVTMYRVAEVAHGAAWTSTLGVRPPEFDASHSGRVCGDQIRPLRGAWIDPSVKVQLLPLRLIEARRKGHCLDSALGAVDEGAKDLLLRQALHVHPLLLLRTIHEPIVV